MREPDASVRNPDWARVPDAAKPHLQRFLDLTRGEPWGGGLPVGGEREFLAELGLELRERFTIGGEESVRRYLTRADGTTVGAQAMAEAMARMAAANASAPAAQQVSPERAREQQRLMGYQIAETWVRGA